jgi:saccharopine dehydrogenase-like NADP-dependent oxidoreductase
MVGAAMAADLSSVCEVVSVDRDAARLAWLAERYPVRTQVGDLGDAAVVTEAIAGADLVVGAAPGFMGYRTLETVICAGAPVVDISFFPEDPFGLDALAKERGVTAVVDCGVAPGLSNMMLGYHAARGPVSSYRCLVGGLPVKRTWPWQYKAPFSPIDVLEEYTRPARLVVDGRVVTRPALSEPELVDLDPVGTLEAFNTDGLRSLLLTMGQTPTMVEKTLRYPGHIDMVRALRESGFLSAEPTGVDGVSVRPIDVAAALLFQQWKLEQGEPEFTIMEVTVEAGGQKHAYLLYDTTDVATGFSSMARTTGYTATAAARLVLAGAFDRKGICPPEYLGAEVGCFERILADLAERGVRVETRAEPL